MHMPRRRERVGARRQERFERRFVRIDFAHGRLLAADAALRAAIGNHGDVAEAERNGAHGVRHVILEGRAANDGRTQKARIDSQVFGESKDRQPALGGG